ncbi:MAG: endonuclease/exonuclease/phosphatase family protein [Chitinophagaceae bacterium]
MTITRFIFVVVYFLLFGCGRKSISGSQAEAGRSMPMDSITILSYNIHHANPPSKPGLIDVQAIADVVRREQPHLVALQEIDVHTRRSGTVLHEAEEIGRLTGLKAYFARAIDHEGGEYGVAILSKYPIKDMKNTALPTDDNTKGEHRTLASATIILPQGRKIIFACTHLDAQHSDVNRQLQVKKILEVFKNETLPVVLAGDLNDLPGSDVIRQLDSHFTRSCIENCPYTIPEISPTKTIDYIAFTPAAKFTVLSHSVVNETYASDHRPLKVLLQVR